MANGNTTILRSGSPKVRSSPCPPSRLKGMQMGHHTGSLHPTRKKFSGKYASRVVQGGIGHNLPQEDPQAFAQAVVEVDGF